MARGGGLDLGIDVDDDDDVPDLVLPSSARHHLCLIVREAVANVLKHAHATTLDFRLHIRSGQLEMTIADDGHGFCPGPASGQGHNGLANMQARATDLGGTVVISSVPGQGTTIRISAPLPTGTGVSAPAVDRRPLGIETDARYDRSGRYS
jgi:signal transduction histidine kinase